MGAFSAAAAAKMTVNNAFAVAKVGVNMRAARISGELANALTCPVFIELLAGPLREAGDEPVPKFLMRQHNGSG